MKSLPRVPVVTLTVSFAILAHFSVATAEEKSIEVKSGDTLSTITAEYYPSYKNNKVLMQALLEANPASFKNQSVNQLIVGKTLRLPDLATIPNLQPPTAPVVATTVDATQNDKQLAALKDQIKALETDKAQLTSQIATLSSTAKSAEPAATVEAIDPAVLMQQLDEIESVNQQILADKNKLVKEQEDLKKQLQTLEADKKQLEAKLAEPTPQPVTNEATSADAADPAILMQQLDEIESANQQILADKQQLEKERDELKQQLQTLQADNKQAEATTSETASTTPSTASPAEETLDTAFLTRQLDEIESANEQLLTDKNKLQSDLETAQQQLKEREQTMSALSGQLSENKQQLDTTQKDLQMAKAAQANAELNKASLEKQRGSWLPWLLALTLLPIGWILGRRSHKLPTEPNPAATAAVATNTATNRSEPVDPSSAPSSTEVPAEVGVASVAPTAAYAMAANDDNVDAAIKLDIVRAYLDLRDSTAASTLLKEVLREGGRQQQQEAREILSFLG